MSRLVPRRSFLAGGGAALLTACSSSGGDTPTAPTITGTSRPGPSAGSAGSSTSRPTDPTAGAGPRVLGSADFEGLSTCGLVPESAAGPFGLDQQFNRRDITENRPGHPLQLGVRVVDGECTPVTGVSVEVWHTDATGDYSAFADGGSDKDEAEGTTFLRGTRSVDDDGITDFLSIYPGWYPGRTPHIHVRVLGDGARLFTGQLYFADDYTATVYTAAAYADNGLPDTANDADPLAGPTLTTGGLVDLAATESPTGAGTLALVNLGIAI